MLRNASSTTGNLEHEIQLENDTALVNAAMAGQTETMKCLMQAGARPVVALSSMSVLRDVPPAALVLLLRSVQPRATKNLVGDVLRNVARLDRGDLVLPILEFVCSALPLHEGLMNYFHNEVLETAARFDCAAVVSSMLALKGDHDLDQDTKNNALVMATLNEHIRIMDMLVSNGASTFIALESVSSSSIRKNVMKKLLTYHQVPTQCLNKALRRAAGHGCVDNIRLLLEEGADIHTKDDAPLVVASENGQVESVGLLLDEGANVHAQYGNALLFAFMNNETAIVRRLIQAGASIDKSSPELEKARRKTKMTAVVWEKLMALVQEKCK